MSSKPVVVLGLCVYLFLGMPGTAGANATKTKNPVINNEKTHKTDAFLALVERVLSKHPAIMSALSDVDIARARFEGSKKPIYNPELEFEAEDADVSTYTIGITQTLDWYGKQSSRNDEASLLLQLADANLVAVKEQVAGELMTVIVRYLNYRDINVVAKIRMELVTRFTKLIKGRQNAGDIGQAEVDTTVLTLTEAIIEHAISTSKLIKTAGEFKALTGENIGSTIPFPTDLPKNIPNKIELETLAAQHPVVLVAESKVRVAKARIQVTKQAGRADPSFGISAGSEGDGTLVALQFSLPLQIRNNFRNDVVASNHAAVRDEQQAQNVYRQVLGPIEATKGQYTVIARAWKVWSLSGQKTLNSHLNNLEILWKTGEISTTQYLVQFQQTLDTKLTGTKLKGDIWQAWIDWLIATGTVSKWIDKYK